MTRHVIGDLQGCLEPLQQLLQKIAFSPKNDQLIFCGDLVNRGPDSLGALRFIRSLGDAAITLLGNHDLHLLAAIHAGTLGEKDTLHDVLGAPDCDELLAWLIQQPLAWQDSQSKALVVHAGVAPQWTLAQTLALAAEAHEALNGPFSERFLANMYGNDPDLWDDGLEGIPRLRFIINCLTRLRYCDPKGHLHMKPKGPPGSQPKGLMPWFQVPWRKTAQDTILFGHWSTLGKIHWPEYNVYGLDTGCVWGGCLSAFNLDTREIISVNCDQYHQPGAIHD